MRTLLMARFIVVSLTTVTLFATMDVPNWAQDLKHVGLYYEGFVEDIDLVRQKHLTAIMSSFGIRRSRSNVNPAETQSVEKCDDHNDKENKMSIYLNSYM